MPLLIGLLPQFIRDFFFPDGFAIVAIEIDCLHSHQVNHALQMVFLANRQLHGDRIDFKFVTKLLDDAIKVGAGTIHFVDEC